MSRVRPPPLLTSDVKRTVFCDKNSNFTTANVCYIFTIHKKKPRSNWVYNSNNESYRYGVFSLSSPCNRRSSSNLVYVTEFTARFSSCTLHARKNTSHSVIPMPTRSRSLPRFITRIRREITSRVYRIRRGNNGLP